MHRLWYFVVWPVCEYPNGNYFKINPNDRFFANKIIDEKQWTPVWYVDINKLSDEYPKFFTDVLESLKKHFW